MNLVRTLPAMTLKAWTQPSAHNPAVRKLTFPGTVRSGSTFCRSEGYAERCAFFRLFSAQSAAGFLLDCKRDRPDARMATMATPLWQS